jgi:streptomycin 6-kinase
MMNQLKYNLTQIYGSMGEDWLVRLPDAIDRLTTMWKLSELKPLSNLSYSYVLEGFQGNLPIILKLSLDIALMNREAIALEAFKGFGTVSVLGHEEGALLLERAIPGTSLKRSSCNNKIEIACGVMKQLHQAPLPQTNLFPHIDEWLADLDKDWDLPIAHLERARMMKKRLIKTTVGPQILLHGDLHQENILSHGNTWVVIDPKGAIGAPIHETWACVENPQRDLKVISKHFGYPLNDVVDWYYVHLILAACWQVEDGLDAGRFLNLADFVLS